MKRAPRKPYSNIRTEHDFKLGGLGPRIGRQKEGIKWSGAFRKLMTTMKDTGRGKSHKVGVTRDRIFHQRVAIRVRYSKRGNPGQWKAHGRYIERESAATGKGFDGGSDPVKPSKKLAEWEEAGDGLIWKIIISPERGDELDLEQFTKDLLGQMDKDLNLRLEWTAAVHKNTQHHHVHLVIRGIDKDGKEVKLPKEYVKRGIRERAQELATAKLGHRLEYDVVLAQTKMVQQPRFTDLDRNLVKSVNDGVAYVNPTLHTGLRQATEGCTMNRLIYLTSIGLAKQLEGHSWSVEPGMEKALRALGQAHDRQRTMDQFGVMASDPSTPVRVTSWRDIDKLEGRVLVHGQEDQKDRAYMLIEDVDGVIRFLDHRKEIEGARKLGRLQPGSYVAMRVKFIGREPHWLIEDFGPAEAAMEDQGFLGGCLARGVDPRHQLGGWLGKFRDVIRGARGGTVDGKTHQQTRRT